MVQKDSELDFNSTKVINDGSREVTRSNMTTRAKNGLNEFSSLNGAMTTKNRTTKE